MLRVLLTLSLSAPLAALMVGAPVRAPVAASRTAAVTMAGKIPSKNVWVDFAPASSSQKGSIISGFQYGIEVAIANVGGKLYGFSNKMPPTGQPTTFAKIEGDCLVEPISLTKYKLSNGKMTGTWCPSPIGRLIIGRLVAESDLETVQVRSQGGKIQALINVNAKAQFEENYWRGVLDAQGKVDGGYY